MIPLDRSDRDNRVDLYPEPNSCFSDSSDSLNSLNSLNSMKVPLHLEKTPLTSICNGYGEMQHGARSFQISGRNSTLSA